VTDVSALAAAWMAQWKAAGLALDEVRRREIRALTDEEALAAAEDLLSLPASTPLPPERLRWSGLVAQQAFLHRRRPR
jgi:hypothetical protein